MFNKKNPRVLGRMIRRLRDIDPRAGTLTFPRDTPLMHNFTLLNTEGKEVRNTNHEAHEQFVVHTFLKPNDSVIELGGGIGTNSIQINLSLKGNAKQKHYVFEPQAELVQLIRQNGKRYNCKFKIVHGVLSKTRGIRVPRFNPDTKQWIYVKATVSASGPTVPSITTLPITPTAIVADCEGCLLQVLTDFPNILDKIRMVYFENDGGRDVLNGVRNLLLERGMHQVVDTHHHKLFILERRPQGSPRRPSASRKRRASR